MAFLGGELIFRLFRIKRAGHLWRRSIPFADISYLTSVPDGWCGGIWKNIKIGAQK